MWAAVTHSELRIFSANIVKDLSWFSVTATRQTTDAMALKYLPSTIILSKFYQSEGFSNQNKIDRICKLKVIYKSVSKYP